MRLARRPLLGRGTKAIDVVRGLGLTNGLKLVLDAGDPLSYSHHVAGQVWLDRSGNGYDFNRGATAVDTTPDPTFATAGALGRNSYWSFDGGDYFTYDSANEQWMKNMHADNALLTCVFWFFSAAATTRALWGNNGGAGTTGTGTHFGVADTNELFFRAVNATASVLSIFGPATVRPVTTWNCVGVSVNEAAGAGGSQWFVNGVSTAFDATYSSPALSSTDSSRIFQIGARGNASAPMSASDRISMALFWEGVALTGQQMSKVFEATRRRFGV